MPMETWSDLPVRDRFRIKFYLDTNILAYLVDNTYSGLTQTINYLKNSEFADLVSSKYVIFEFVGIRKREHYLQKVLDKSKSSVSERVNISSLLKYKDNFNAPEVKFEDVQADIKTTVETELQNITTNFGIDYSANILHDSLLSPTFDINLSSKVSKEDSLVLTSAVWTDATTKESFVVLASNDQQFFESYDTSLLNPVFTSHGLTPPVIEHLRDIKLLSGTKVNLTDSNDDAILTTFLPSKLTELILAKNKSLYLGKTFPPAGAGFPTDAICFKLQPNTPLNNNIYLTIIGKNLDLIYSVKCPVTDFFNNSPTPIATYPFTNAAEVNIAFTPKDDATGTPLSLDAAIINRLREEGNLIFINPDGID
jgi:hypothetical protein